MSEQWKHRTVGRRSRSWKIALAGMRGDPPVRDVCREHEIAETLYCGWRDRRLEADRKALSGKE